MKKKFHQTIFFNHSYLKLISMKFLFKFQNYNQYILNYKRISGLNLNIRGLYSKFDLSPGSYIVSGPTIFHGNFRRGVRSRVIRDLTPGPIYTTKISNINYLKLFSCCKIFQFKTRSKVSNQIFFV